MLLTATGFLKSHPRLHIREICERIKTQLIILAHGSHGSHRFSCCRLQLVTPSRATQGSISVESVKSVRELKFTPNLLAIYFLNQPHHLLSETQSRPRLKSVESVISVRELKHNLLFWLTDCTDHTDFHVADCNWFPKEPPKAPYPWNLWYLWENKNTTYYFDSRIARITQIFMLLTATGFLKSRPRLHIREICEICERIKTQLIILAHGLHGSHRFSCCRLQLVTPSRAAQGSISVESVISVRE